MYSVPLRSVQMFLQAIEQVWQPMHLSRWNTIETCERTFMIVFPSLVRVRGSNGSPFQFWKLAHQHMSVSVASRRSPIVEVKSKLPISAGHQVRLQTCSSEAVVASGATMPAQRGGRHRICPFR